MSLLSESPANQSLSSWYTSLKCLTLLFFPLTMEASGLLYPSSSRPGINPFFVGVLFLLVGNRISTTSLEVHVYSLPLNAFLFRLFSGKIELDNLVFHCQFSGLIYCKKISVRNDIIMVANYPSSSVYWLFNFGKFI